MSNGSALRDIQVLRDSIGRIMRALSGSKINVVQQGMKAYVKYTKDGRPETVYLPSLPDNTSRELMFAIQGFLDHECAHLLFTDFTVSTDEMKARGQWGKEPSKEFKLRMAFWNCIEDCWIEQAMRKRFYGSDSNLKTLQAFVIDRVIRETFKKAQASGEQSAVNNALVPTLFRAAAGQSEFIKFADEVNAFGLTGLLGEAIKDRSEAIRKCDTTKEAWRLANEIIDALQAGGEGEGEGEDEGESKNKPKNKGEGKGSTGVSDEGADDSEGEASGKGKSGKSNKDKKSDNKTGKDDGESESDEGGEDEGKSDGSEGEDESEGDEKGEAEGSKGKDESEDESEDEGESSSAEGDDAEDGSDEESEGDADETEESEDDLEEGEVYDPEQEVTEADSIEGAGEGAGGVREAGKAKDVTLEFDPDEIKPMDEAAAQAVSETINADLSRSTDIYLPFSRDGDYMGPLPPLKTRLTHNDIAEAAGKTAHILQSEIERVFKARSASRWLPAQRKGKIQPNGLHRLMTNDDRVFRQRIEATTRDVALQLVIDMSGSMGGEKIKQACIAAHIFASIMERIKVSCEIVSFTTMTAGSAKTLDMKDEFDRVMGGYQDLYDRIYSEGYGGKAEEEASRYSRFAPTTLYVLKAFNARFGEEEQMKLGALGMQVYQNLMANNVDGESIEQAAYRLLQRKEKRKVMIVMSDGQPACDGRGDHGRDYLHKTIARISASGVELFGLGLLSNAVKTYYKQSEVVNKTDEIPEKILNIARKLVAA